MSETLERRRKNQPKRVVKLNEGSKKARRSAARLASSQAIYQMLHNEEPADQVLQEYIDHRIGFEIEGDVLVPADIDMLTDLLKGYEKRADDVAEIVKGALGHRATGAELLLQAILSSAVYELLEKSDVDTPLIISEYLNVTHAFYDEKTAGLVNGILDKLAKTLR